MIPADLSRYFWTFRRRPINNQAPCIWGTQTLQRHKSSQILSRTIRGVMLKSLESMFLNLSQLRNTLTHYNISNVSTQSWLICKKLVWGKKHPFHLQQYTSTLNCCFKNVHSCLLASYLLKKLSSPLPSPPQILALLCKRIDGLLPFDQT